MKSNVNGVTYYYEWFSKYIIDRPTLVCLHGFTGTSESFSEVFQEEGVYNILGIDLIGHGQTDVFVHPYRYQMNCLCEDIVSLTEKLGIFSFSLMGYSMGARVALGLTSLFPYKVNQLILESGSPGLKSQLDRSRRKLSDQQLAGFIMSHGIEPFVEKWERLPLFTTQSKLPLSIQESVRQERLSQKQVGLACSLWFMGTGVQPSFWENLSTIHIPVALIVGEQDTKFIEIAEQMKREQPMFLIEVVSGVGHCVHLEKPKEFARIVHSFLEGGSRNADLSD